MSPKKLYMRGMAQLRAAQWKAAVETLIADALLKTEIDRLRAPDGLAPHQERLLRPRFLTAVLVLFVLGGALLIALRPFGGTPAPAAPQPTFSATLLSPVPTDVPPATPKPTATEIPN